MNSLTVTHYLTSPNDERPYIAQVEIGGRIIEACGVSIEDATERLRKLLEDARA